MVVKNKVEEFRKQNSHGVRARGYPREEPATSPPKRAMKKHHNNIEPSIPPQMAVIL
jgi:hypothetical protein